MTTKRTSSRSGLRVPSITVLGLLACNFPDKSLGDLASTSEGSQGGTSTTSDEGAVTLGDDGSSGGSSTGGGQMFACGDPDAPPPTCLEDVDRDNVRLACDNAPDYTNPSQSNLDGDLFGDIADVCQTIADDTQADSDHDGIGNACDSCPATAHHYASLIEGSLPDGLRHRNVPDVGDLDGDGVGDACDNCVAVPNCGDYDTSAPWRVGDPIDRDDTSTCQADTDHDGVGDACQGLVVGPLAVATVGMGPAEDFDQDGLANAVDACPRLPLEQTDDSLCDGDGDCPDGSHCEARPGHAQGVCDHPDHDGDGIGDACDTCAANVNPGQITDGGLQADDADGDFVGAACEGTSDCEDRENPAPSGFYERSAAGRCCTALLHELDDGTLVVSHTGLPLVDPDGRPVRLTCSDADVGAGLCRRLPAAVAARPGVLEAPPGCEALLGGAPAWSIGELTISDVASIDDLWHFRCELPQFDQDYDGVDDTCDYCPFSFDPDNIVYIDAKGVVWDHFGKYCNGDYSVEKLCGE